MKILFLYAEVMGYTLATMRELCIEYNAELHVVHWVRKKITPFKIQDSLNITFYERSKMDVNQMKLLSDYINPDIVFISGWQDKGYMRVAWQMRQKGVPVVMGLDGQWKGTIKQQLAKKIRFSRKWFYNYAWVSGTYQYEMARHLGFKKDNIIFDLYSADLTIFQNAYIKSKTMKLNSYPQRFLFVGRLEKVKGLDLLIEAWDKISEKQNWELHFIGNGAMRSKLKKHKNVVIKDFMQPTKLVEEILNYGCFILPSRSEPWGVVLHEFAAAGLPIICSDVCGAAQTFLINGLNGYTFKSEDINSLVEKIYKIISADNQTLVNMSKMSNELSSRITPKTSASNLLSIIK